MAKRFTDTAKWKKEFIKGLPAKYKLLWFYILDDCDHAGIWEVDFEVASLRIGEQVGYDDSFRALGSQIQVIGKNRWWIKDFIFFQYGSKFTATNKMYAPVMAILTKYGIKLIPHNMEHLPPIDGVIVKDKDKDKDKVNTDNESEEIIDPEVIDLVIEGPEQTRIFEEMFTDELFVEGIARGHKNKNIQEAWEQCWLYHSQKPSPPQQVWEWKQKLSTWLNNIKNGSSKKADTVNARRAGFAKRHSSDAGS